eukprot:Hpha_TRINITY_DN10916_c0_g3::TRINITY_DN10916_c0_g3_i1::g.26774::m.26774/K08177/oxlT; MFS transporter, OFA family, oxalate/formate antiporter
MPTIQTVRVVVLIASVFVGMPVGSFYSWSVFIDPVTAARPNFSLASTVHANSIVICALGFACAISGKIIGRQISVRKLSAAGAVVSGAGLALCGGAIWWNIEVLMYGGAFFNGFGMGGCYVAFIKAVKTAWAHRAGFAAGWVMMISSSGSFFFTWICQALLDHFSKKDKPLVGPTVSYLIFGGLLFVMQFFGSFLLWPTPPDVQEPPLESPPRASDAEEAAGDASSSESAPVVSPKAEPMTTKALLQVNQFWLVMYIFFANLFPMIGILSVLAAYLHHQYPADTSSNSAANYLSLINAVGAVMRLFVGLVADKVGARRLFTLVLITQTGLLVLLYCVIRSITLGPLVVLLCFLKICFGSGFTLVNLLVGNIFGAENGTQVYGLVILSLSAASVTAPNLIVLWWKQASDGTITGKDIRPFIAIGIGVVASGFFAILLLRKVGTREEGKPLLDPGQQGVQAAAPSRSQVPRAGRGRGT